VFIVELEEEDDRRRCCWC